MIGINFNQIVKPFYLKGENKKAFFKEEKIRLSRNYNIDTKDKTLVG